MGASEDRPRATLALLGLRCSGKTTVGRLLAQKLGLSFLDLDLETVRVARQAGLDVASVGELLRSAGQARFRDLEAGALRRVLEPCPRLVLATGGGAVERSDNRAWLARTARCVYLSVPLAELGARLAADPTDRPVLQGTEAAAELEGLLREREPFYRELAEIVVECGSDGAEVIASQLVVALEGTTRAPEEAAPETAAPTAR
jgi:shikimate kinase